MCENIATYSGNDLGAVYTRDNTRFRLWAPTAERAEICFYAKGDGGEPTEIRDMSPDEGGTWIYEKSGDLHKLYYTYRVTIQGNTRETNDPYAKAAGVNGFRSMVVDLAQTDPQDFENDRGPILEKPTDAIIYEISVADTTADESCGVRYPGKYPGLTQRGSRNANGVATGLDHIIESGVTHVQIMPSYDFGSIDESQPDVEQYNWGYDPVNYNVPEGSYSTDPFHGEVRIREYKQMVQAFHSNGIGVIMDVVYNHTFDIEGNCFQKCVPDYYYRKREDGSYSDASGCGNEIASEKVMVRKYIIDSLTYWAKEYHVDGFRFDLMGVLDVETMNLAAEELRKINPSILLYGEGWTGGSSVIPDEKRALKCNAAALNGIGVFSDDIRDAVKGHVFYEGETGFVSGKQGMEQSIRFAVTGATEHGQVDYEKCIYSRFPWAKGPSDTINYVSCHDNLTLWDKLTISCLKVQTKRKLAMNRLAAAIVMTSQGIPFFLSGEEFARSKPIEGTDQYSENSYNLPIYTNRLDYNRLTLYRDLFEYYKGLVAFRKAHAGLRFSTKEEVQKNICFMEDLPDNVVAFTVDTEEETILVIYNANPVKVSINLPKAAVWEICIERDTASPSAIRNITRASRKIEIYAVSCLVAVSRKNP